MARGAGGCGRAGWPDRRRGVARPQAIRRSAPHPRADRTEACGDHRARLHGLPRHARADSGPRASLPDAVPRPRDDLRLEDWLARRIWPLEAAHTEETVYWSALLGVAELLLGGTTAILDMETVHHTGAAFEALDRSGIRATAGKCLMDAHPEGAPLELAESTDAALAEAESLARRWHGAAGGRLRWCFAPRFVPSCSGPLLRAASDLAERHGAQLHTHAAETIVERETVLRTTGLEEIAYLDSVGIAGPRAAVAHCVWVDQHEIARLAAQGTNVVHCPSSNLKLGSGVARVPGILQAGCRVALGSDGAACNNRLDVFTEMRLAALIQKPRHGADV